MSRSGALLDALAAIAASNNELLPGELQPGLSRTELDAFLVEADFPVKPPEEWFHIYEWRNGTLDDGRDRQLFHYHRFAPVQEALADRHFLEALHDGSSHPPPLLPLFTFMGEWYAMDCSSDTVIRGRILFLFQGDNVAYDNLETMLESILECYMQGAYRYENGETIVDEPLVAQIKLRRNRCRAAEPHLAEAAHP
jgi:hypothetical protein